MAAQREVFICGVARTPIGNINGSLASLSAPALGALSIREALARARVSPAEVQEVYMGNVLTANVGQAPARQAARAAGIPDSCVCTTVNKVCASGAKAIILAAQARSSSSRFYACALVRSPHARCATQSIILGTAEVAVAGGMESMSNAPYLLPKARAGMKMGHGEVVDAVIKDGLWDPYGNVHMGICAEKCSRCANAAKRGSAESAERAACFVALTWRCRTETTASGGLRRTRTLLRATRARRRPSRPARFPTSWWQWKWRAAARAHRPRASPWTSLPPRAETQPRSQSASEPRVRPRSAAARADTPVSAGCRPPFSAREAP
jgi:hypothetical protein